MLQKLMLISSTKSADIQHVKDRLTKVFKLRDLRAKYSLGTSLDRDRQAKILRTTAYCLATELVKALESWTARPRVPLSTSISIGASYRGQLAGQRSLPSE